MREEALDILSEPTTGARLRLERAVRAGDRIVAGSLVSEQTGRAYPIVRGIPRFVENGYADSFGLQWNQFRMAQLDSSTGSTYSRARFDAETGWAPERIQGKWVLDAGCGAGRFAEIAASRGAKVIAMDLSSAVEAASQTLAPYSNATVVQGNLLAPPVRAGAFDFAYCIGVIQHTPDRNAAIASVVRTVRPGGEFCLTIYARRPWTKLNAKYLVRPITRRLPNDVLLKAIEAAMPVLFPVTDKLFRVPVLGKVAQFVIPVATYVRDGETFDHEQRYREAILDTFDMLSPRFDSPMTWQEVAAALEQAGAGTWEFKTRVPGINCVGQR